MDEKRKLLGNFENILNENSVENLNFYFIFRKFVTKNRAFRNNTIFSNNFFGFGGGGFPPFPLASPLIQCVSRLNQKFYGFTLSLVLRERFAKGRSLNLMHSKVWWWGSRVNGRNESFTIPMVNFAYVLKIATSCKQALLV